MEQLLTGFFDCRFRLTSLVAQFNPKVRLAEIFTWLREPNVQLGDPTRYGDRIRQTDTRNTQFKVFAFVVCGGA